MKCCRDCKNVFYCSPTCQMNDWQFHKKICLKCTKKTKSASLEKGSQPKSREEKKKKKTKDLHINSRKIGEAKDKKEKEKKSAKKDSPGLNEFLKALQSGFLNTQDSNVKKGNKKIGQGKKVKK